MKTQISQRKSDSRNHADSVGHTSQEGQLQSSVNTSPLMAAQRMQKESLQMAGEKKKPAQKAEDKKKKPGQKKSDKEL